MATFDGSVFIGTAVVFVKSGGTLSSQMTVYPYLDLLHTRDSYFMVFLKVFILQKNNASQHQWIKKLLVKTIIQVLVI